MTSNSINIEKNCLNGTCSVAFDKAYSNYEQFALLGQRGIFYVIPQKDNATYKSIREFELNDDEPAILKDELIEVSYKIEEEGIIIQKTLQHLEE